MHNPASAPEGAPISTRCKIGDLAFIIGSADPRLIGLMVTVIAREIPPPFGYPAPWDHLSKAPHWLVEASRPVPTYAHDTVTRIQWRGVGNRFTVPDPHLQPVRDGEGADESLRWADVPSTEKVAA